MSILIHCRLTSNPPLSPFWVVVVLSACVVQGTTESWQLEVTLKWPRENLFLFFALWDSKALVVAFPPLSLFLSWSRDCSTYSHYWAIFRTTNAGLEFRYFLRFCTRKGQEILFKVLPA